MGYCNDLGSCHVTTLVEDEQSKEQDNGESRFVQEHGIGGQMGPLDQGPGLVQDLSLHRSKRQKNKSIRLKGFVCG